MDNEGSLDIVSENDAVSVEDLSVDSTVTDAVEPTEVAGTEEQERDEKGQFTPKKQSAQERINEITAARRQAERDLATEKAVNATLLAQMNQTATGEFTPPTSTFAEAEPRLEDYSYDPVLHAQAVGAYGVRKKMADDDANRAASAVQADQMRSDASWNVRREEAETAAPGFNAKVDAIPSSALTVNMAQVIKASPRGIEVAAHLADNHALSAEIAALPTDQQGYRLGMIEAGLSTQTRSPSAPPPVAPVAGGGEIPSKDWMSDPNISNEDWAKRRNQELYEQRYGKK